MDCGILLNNLKDHCEFLADPRLNGRVPGEEGNRLARDYIRQQFEQIGLTPLFGQEWIQEYLTKASGKAVTGANVAGQLKVGDACMSTASIIVGAHYDHLQGIPGADDNASSVAIMIETARILAQRDQGTRRKNIVFVAFDTEERPYYLTQDMGSVHFYHNNPIQQIDCAVIMDLCGHDFPVPGREDAIFLMGADSSPTLAEILPSIKGENITPFIINDRYSGDKSDYHAFKSAGIPYVFLSVGWWECYHKPCDTLERLNYEKMAATCILLEGIVTSISAMAIHPALVDTTDIEARSISNLVGREIKADRATLDAIVAKIKSAYLGRSG
jgi:Peptidase family M28